MDITETEKKQMEQVFLDFMSNLPDFGTIGRSCIFEEAKKFHEEMVSFVSNNRNKD